MISKSGTPLERNSIEKEQTIGEILYQLGGFQVASIKNISFRFFVVNKAELLDFQLIAQLLEMEQITGILSGKIDRLADFAYEHANDGSVEAKLKFSYMLMDVIDSENNLLEAYSNFLKGNQAYLGRSEEEQ